MREVLGLKCLMNGIRQPWVKWVHTYLIKFACFWTMKVPQNVSWTVRKILNLRNLAQPWIKRVVGNRQDTFLCWDNWHPLGPLY